MHVSENNHPIVMQTKSLISTRYKRITKAVNLSFWESSSDTAHSIYVGSYGRGTAIETSDLDVLIELPESVFQQFSDRSGNGQSQLLQVVKSAIQDTYATTDISGDGQVVVVNFTDGIKFEILPAFRNTSSFGNWDGTYKYPDTHMGGNWLTTNPRAEQEAMDNKDTYVNSNGLLKDTCKHIRYVRSRFYPNAHLSGILIDTFVFEAIKGWHWCRDEENRSGLPSGAYEQSLLDYYNGFPYSVHYSPTFSAPGSRMTVKSENDWAVLGKVLKKMVD